MPFPITSPPHPAAAPPQTREDSLHRALLDLAATAPALLSGDPGYAGAQVAMREASNAMMELALTLGDRCG